MAIRSVINEIANATEGLVRVVVLTVILRPAAYLLPRRWGLAVAEVVSLVLLLLPRPGVPAFLEARDAFGLGYLEALGLARRRLLRPLADFVILNRLLYGREDVVKWTIIEKNADGIARLRATGKSFIIATGHFGRAAFAPMYFSGIIPGRRIHVGAPIPSAVSTLAERQARLQYSVTMRALSSLLDRVDDVVYVSPQHRSPALPIYKKLRRGGTVVYVHVDAPWAWRKSDGGVHVRPFLGNRRREFATGVARLAQLAKCPIITCVPYLESDGTVVLEWGAPFMAGDDEVATTDCLLDVLEVAVGNRPDHYVLPVGRDRRWSCQRQRWEGSRSSQSAGDSESTEPSA